MARSNKNEDAKENEATEATAEESGASEAQETPGDENVGGITPMTGNVDEAKAEANTPPEDGSKGDEDPAKPYTHDAAEQAAVERAKAEKI